MVFTSRRAFAKKMLALSVALPSGTLAISQRGGKQSASTFQSMPTPEQGEAYRQAQRRFEASQKRVRDFHLKFETEPDFIFQATR